MTIQTSNGLIKLAKQAGFNLEFDDYVYEHWDNFQAFAKLVETKAAERERAIYDHDTRVLMDALWKSCGDDEEAVRDTIESQGTLIRGEAT